MPFPTYLVTGPRVGLAPYRPADGPEFTARARESRDLHEPWLFPPTTVEEYEPYAARLAGGEGRAGFLVRERATGALAGFVNINNIVLGAFRCGALGYGAFAHAAGRGLLGEALDLVLAHAFAPQEGGGLGCTAWRRTSSRATPPPSPSSGGAASVWRGSRRTSSTWPEPGGTTNAGP